MSSLRARLIRWSVLLSVFFMAMMIASYGILSTGMRRSEMVQHKANMTEHLVTHIDIVLHDLDSRLWLVNASDALRRLMNNPLYLEETSRAYNSAAVKRQFSRYFQQLPEVKGLVIVGRNDLFAFYPAGQGRQLDRSDVFHYQDFASNPLLSPYFSSNNTSWYASFAESELAGAESDMLLYQWLDGHVTLSHTVFGEDNIILGEIILLLSDAFFDQSIMPLMEEGDLVVLRDATGEIAWQGGLEGEDMTLLLKKQLAPLPLVLECYMPTQAFRVNIGELLRRLMPYVLILLALIIPVAWFFTHGYKQTLAGMNQSMGDGDIPAEVGRRKSISRYLWERIPIRRLLTTYFILTVTVPTLIFSVLVLWDNYTDHMALVNQDAQLSTRNLRISLEQRLDYLDSVGEIFSQTEAVTQLAADHLSAGVTEAQRQALDQVAHRMRMMTNQLLSINLYTLEGRNVYSSQYLEYQPASMFTGGFMRQLRNAGSSLHYLGMTEHLYPDVPLLFGRKLAIPGRDEPWGYMTMLIDQRFLTNVASKTRLVRTGYFFLLSENGQWLDHDGRRQTAAIMTPALLSELLAGDGAIRHAASDAQSYDLFYGYMEEAPFCVVGAIPRREILERTMPLIMASLLLAVAYLALSSVVAAKVSARVAGPIQSLSRLMETVGSGEWPEMQYTQRNELGQLVEKYNEMVRRLEELIHENYIVRLNESHLQLAQKEAQFKALQQQINPHFLYNTLDAIKWMAHKKGATEAYDMTVALGNFFRGVITQGVDIVTVEEELALLENYLYIQKIRFGERFDFAQQVDPNALECKTLKLMLQPLVENAIIHGLERVEEGGLITISVRRDNGCLEYAVTDNGEGVDADVLARLQALLRGERAEGATDGIGLSNVYRRLKLHFGDAAQMEIDSHPGQGTCVLMRFPRTPA